MKLLEFTGGPDTTRGKRLAKWLDKNKAGIARDIAGITSKYELSKDVDWWLDDISKQVLDGDYFNDLYQHQPVMWDTFVEAWNSAPEYYANIVWSEMIHRYKKFGHYRNDN